jgi:hypothetical protein
VGIIIKQECIMIKTHNSCKFLDFQRGNRRLMSSSNLVIINKLWRNLLSPSSGYTSKPGVETVPVLSLYISIPLLHKIILLYTKDRGGIFLQSLSWTEWHWGWFSLNTSVSPTTHYSTNCSTVITIYHPGLVQQATKWPQ